MIPEWLRQRCLLCSATVLLSVCHLPNTCKDRCLCSTGINSEGIIGDVSPKNIRVGYNYRETSRNWHKKVSPISRNVFILVFSVIKYKIWVFLSYGLDSQEWWFLAIIVHLAHLMAQLVLDWLRDTTGICLPSVCDTLMLLLNRLSVHNWNARCHRTWPQFSTAPACWCGSACMCVIRQHSVSCVYLMRVFMHHRVYIWASVCLGVQLIVFITYIILRKNQDDPVIPSSKVADAPRDSPLIYQPARRYEAWRFLTYMLIHHQSVDLLNLQSFYWFVHRLYCMCNWLIHIYSRLIYVYAWLTSCLCSWSRLVSHVYLW